MSSYYDFPQVGDTGASECVAHETEGRRVLYLGEGLNTDAQAKMPSPASVHCIAKKVGYYHSAMQRR